MSNYRARPSRPDRAKAIAAVVAVYAAIGALLLIRPDLALEPTRPAPTVLIDIEPPLPPPPPIEPQVGRTRDEQGAAGKKADPTPVVAPEPKIAVPSPQLLPAAQVAGSGSSPNSGATNAGTGTGGGGSGNGRGGGGPGGGGIGIEARLLSGGLSRSDYRSLRRLGASSGAARLAILVGPDGRVARCGVANSSGNAELDRALCAILEPRMRWASARDKAGNPISVQIYYVTTWQRY